MIPILYEKDETAFASNGLGRLRDCIECTVSEERNGVYEADFSYPLTGANFDQIRVGRIIGVTHDETDDIQPFDIVSYSRPIDGVVKFHCTHISYRQSYLTATGSNIQTLADAFTLLGTAEPDNPFSYQTDKTSIGFMSAADGKPKSVRSLLGGVEGSILDTYGGEYEWDKFRVILHESRGVDRPFSIRYGVNMLDYNEDFDIQGSYSSCIPFWTDGTNTVIGDRQDSPNPTVTGRGECVPLDVSDKFESQPTKAEVESMGLSVMSSKRVFNPTQTIKVEFARLQELGEGYANLYRCKLCDTINVVFPDYNASGQFKIVKTVWNVLKDRYDSMELGTLSTTLSEALGIGVESRTSYSGGGGGTDDYTELTNKPQINNVTLTGNKTSSQIGVADAVHTHTVSQITDFPTLATVATSGNYNDLSNKPSIPTITDTYDGTSSNGMSGKAVKSAIDALDGTISGSPGAGKTLTAFSQTDGKVSATFGNISITKSQVSDFPTLATVATSGDYDDLIDKPTLSAVATSGDYDDLINKPTIPTVNDATLTIQKNGTTVNTFTANASSNVTANITVPTNNNELTNGAGYITSPNIPYCTCATAAGTKAKTTTIVSGTFTEANLVTGAQVLVKFTNSNTVADPTLKIGSTTAKSIKRYGTTAPSTSAASSWNANSVIMFTYDGTYWQMTDYNNTTYSSMTTAEYEAGTGTTARTITPARLKGAIQYWDAVTSVNSKTGAVTLTASDVGALPDTTTIPSKLSDLTNDLIYDLGTVTVNAGVFSVSADDVTAITSLWNDGYCGLKLTVNSKDYYAYKERMITYNTLSFMGFVAVEADITSNIVTTGKTIVGINSSGVGMFAVISDFVASEVPSYETDPLFTASAASGITTSDINDWNGKQDALVSGTNIKTINNNSILGPGNLDIGGGQSVQEIFIAQYGTTTYSDIYDAYDNNKELFLNYSGLLGSVQTVLLAPSVKYLPSSNTFVFYAFNGLSQVYSFTVTNSDTWSYSVENLVPTTRTINSKALSSDITLTASDVGALADTYTAPVTSVNSKTGAVSLSASDVGALATTGGEVTGNVTLKAGAGQNSPSLIFQRGTLTDNYNDWQIYDKSGFLYFGQRGSGSTAFADQVYFNTTGGVIATSFTGSGTNLTDVVHPTRTINGKALSSDITLTASDVGALADTYTAPVTSVNSKTGAVTLTASDVGALSSSTTYVSSVNGSSGAITGIQTTGNLVTSVSSASTDTEYPSAKLLYDITRKSVVQATGSTSSTSLTNGTITQIPLTTYIANDETNATWNDTQKGIEILTAGYYKIQGSVYFKSTGTSISAIGAYIKVASNGGAFSTASEVLGGYTATGKISNDYVSKTPAKLVYLNANDIVYLCGRVSGANGTAQPDNRATFLLVEQV